MIPLRDHNPSSRFAFITYVLITINVFIFFYMFSLPEATLETFITTYAIIPQQIVNGQNLFTIITAMFLHGSLMHLVGNMLFLHIFGDNLEDHFGHFLFLLFYLASGIAASLLQIFIDPSSTIPNLGASGAIAGLMGGYLLLFPNHKIDILIPFGGFLSTATVPAFTMLFYWIVFQFISGVGQTGLSDTGGVAYWAHIGGFIAGIFLTWILRLFTRSDLSRLNY